MHISSVLTPKRRFDEGRVFISIPDKSAFNEFSCTHSGKLPFDEEVEMYLNSMIESIKPNLRLVI